MYHLDKLIISTFLSNPFGGIPINFYRNKVFAKFIPQQPRKKSNRIYISREKAYNGRKVINEDELLEVVNKLNFKKVVLESIPINEQIKLFYNAEIVIAPHGAGLTNTIFSDQINIVELFPGHTCQPHFYFLSKSVGHTYQYWRGEKHNINSDFIVDIPSVKGLLTRLL